MVTIVGIGPGNKKLLTLEALEIIQKAKVLLGGQRHLDLFDEVKAKKIPIKKGLDFEQVFSEHEDIVVLASGDPGIYGILDLVLRHVGEENVQVIPGISSVQYFMAILKIPFKQAALVSLHGRQEELISKVEKYDTVFVLTDSKNTPQAIAKFLLEEGIKDREIFIGENLSYDDERISRYSLEELSKENRQFELNMVVIRKCGNTE